MAKSSALPNNIQPSHPCQRFKYSNISSKSLFNNLEKKARHLNSCVLRRPSIQINTSSKKATASQTLIKMTTRHTIKSIQQLLTHHSTLRPTQTRSLSSRALTSHLRNQHAHSLLRSALAMEASSLRYSLLLSSLAEEEMMRGWDVGVCEEDDGTWVYTFIAVWV